MNQLAFLDGYSVLVKRLHLSLPLGFDGSLVNLTYFLHPLSRILLDHILPAYHHLMLLLELFPMVLGCLILLLSLLFLQLFLLLFLFILLF